DFTVSVLLSAGIVLVYTYLGGLTSAIYNEVLQFFLIVAGFVPLVIIGLIDVGGWDGLTARLASEAVSRGFEPGAMTASWSPLASPAANPMGVEWFGLVMGLGFVLSFGYWCTDFLVVQRAMAADSMNAARRTPIIAAVPKMLFPALVILPGMIAIAIAPRAEIGIAGADGAAQYREGAVAQTGPAVPLARTSLIPPKIDETTGEPIVDADGRVALDYDLAIPMMLRHYFPTGLLGLGLCALLASFMSGMAGNTTAFNTVWTYDIYQSYIRPHAPDAHYLAMGRAATVFGIGAAVAAAYVAREFNNIMDLLQLVFAFVNAPLFATFMLGMFWKRATGHGAFTGLLAGTLAAAVHHGLTLPAGAVAGVKGGFLGSVLFTYPSEMAQNFWTAIVAWTTCFIVTILVSVFTEPRRDEELTGLVYSLTPKPADRGLPWHKQPGPLAIGVLGLTLVLNVIFW
ncbi:MAG TPA: hypothetical protein VIL25_04550, partial [Vicinamibacterales bacterium]